jgi:hypothetical protein
MLYFIARISRRTQDGGMLRLIQKKIIMHNYWSRMQVFTNCQLSGPFAGRAIFKSWQQRSRAACLIYLIPSLAWPLRRSKRGRCSCSPNQHVLQCDLSPMPHELRCSCSLDSQSESAPVFPIRLMQNGAFLHCSDDTVVKDYAGYMSVRACHQHAKLVTMMMTNPRSDVAPGQRQGRAGRCCRWRRSRARPG